MPGPTIRNWELARVLASRFEVTLAAPGQTAVKGEEFDIVAWGDRLPKDLILRHDVVKASGFLVYEHPQIAAARHLVADLYDPFPLENLHMYDDRVAAERYRIASHDRDVQTGLARAGDVFLCASERQRDFWLGWLSAVGRVNPYMHEADAAMDRFLLVVPFGVPDQAPRPSPPRFRGVVDGIRPDDLIVVWGGGIWNWFDPLTVIRAAAVTADRLPNLRVIFPATSVPSPDVLPMRMLLEARNLAVELGVHGSRVFFGGPWIPYREHGGVLLESDVGVSLHQPSVETRFSFRTRILDYLWAGLPIIATEGDSMADLVRKENLGFVVAPADLNGVVEALLSLGTDHELRRRCGSRSRQAADRFRWSVVAAPLIEFCADPYNAPDREVIRSERWPAVKMLKSASQPEALRLVSRTAEVLKDQGPRRLASMGAAYVSRRRKGNRPRSGEPGS
jgi:glycosyltransferase involved in cell wall biosynthesis